MLSSRLVVVALVVYLTEAKTIHHDIAKRWSEVTKPYKKYCITESRATEDDVDKIVSEGVLVDVKDMGCYLKCVYEKLNVFEPDGKINNQVITDTFFYMTPELTERCKQEVAHEKGPCRKPYLYGLCVLAAIAI